MAPHDQQEWVSSGRGLAPISVSDGLLNFLSLVRDLLLRVFAILRQKHLRRRPVRVHEGNLDFAGGVAGLATSNHAENDVPHPQDFVACGLTKTNPCCISVS